MTSQPLEDRAHPLEGKYIVFSYHEEDREGYGDCLVLYKLEKSKLVPIFDTLTIDGLVSGWGEASALGSDDDKHVIDFLKRKGINEVYTVLSFENFFGLKRDITLQEDVKEGEEVECWGEYNGIFDRDFTGLEENGIKLINYDEATGKLEEIQD